MAILYNFLRWVGCEKSWGNAFRAGRKSRNARWSLSLSLKWNRSRRRQDEGALKYGQFSFLSISDSDRHGHCNWDVESRTQDSERRTHDTGRGQGRDALSSWHKQLPRAEENSRDWAGKKAGGWEKVRAGEARKEGGRKKGRKREGEKYGVRETEEQTPEDSRKGHGSKEWNVDVASTTP